MTYPGGPTDPHQPYGQQPYPPVPWSTEPPNTGSTQKGLKGALIAIGALFAVIVLVVGGYFAFQRVFTDSPSEVVSAYIDEARKDHPDRLKIADMLCRTEADKLRNQVAGDDDSDNDSLVDWHVTGEKITGDTATVTTEYTVKTLGTQTKTSNLSLALVKEDREWKICSFAD
ncbi:hypothetical protein ACQP00_22945 [Dactylosporangium sp. CS-047395]|uniref:Rv0361 family membrane protein n=1 Tax=Dactylosporangium sp. CS-047395 TaxID=3239936 RepID=UPI003D95096D